MAHQFGVRRPVRFLSHKLELNDSQTKRLAKIIGDLKTERAQAEVDNRKAISAFADAVAEADFNEELADQGATTRKESKAHVTDEVVKTIKAIHEMLDDEQKEKLAYLIRTGMLSL